MRWLGSSQRSTPWCWTSSGTKQQNQVRLRCGGGVSSNRDWEIHTTIQLFDWEGATLYTNPPFVSSSSVVLLEHFFFNQLGEFSIILLFCNHHNIWFLFQHMWSWPWRRGHWGRNPATKRWSDQEVIMQRRMTWRWFIQVEILSFRGAFTILSSVLLGWLH